MIMTALLMMTGCASTTPVFDESLCPAPYKPTASLLVKPEPLKPIEGGTIKQILPVVVDNNRSCAADKERLRLLINEIETFSF